MSDLIWLSDAQLERISPYFPLSHGIARVDDGRVLSGIIFVIRNGLRRRDARYTTARTRQSTTGSSAGAGLACSTGYWQNWQLWPARPVR